MLVSAHGGFDPLHPGHIAYLEGSYALRGPGDRFIVILARDDQLAEKNRRLGYPKKRPPVPYEARRRVIEWGLRGRECEVVPNVDKDITMCESLYYYRPNIVTQGGDRKPGNVDLEEERICREIGCTVVYGVGGYEKEYSSRNM